MELLDNDFVAKIMETLAVALLLPLLSPVIKFFDRGRKRAETLRRLELLKLLTEVDTAILQEPKQNYSLYKTEYDQLINDSSELRSLFQGLALHDNKSPITFSPFDWKDFICALIGPAFVSLGMLSEYPGPLVPVLLFTVSAIISLLIAKYVVCKYIASGAWQGFWQIFSGVASVLPTIVVVAAIALPLGIEL